MNNILSNITIVLDRTRHASNIGAVCRVMKNLGLKNLTLVNPTEYGHLAGIRMLRGSEDILESSKVVPSVDIAVSECHYSFATSHRMEQKSAIGLQEAAQEIVQRADINRIAIIFGSEKYGLYHKDIVKAHRVVKLPTENDFPSLNVSQAVAIFCMQIKLAMEKAEKPKSKPIPLRHKQNLETGERERLNVAFASLFEDAGFANPSIIEKIRDIFNRANLNKREQNLFLGLIKELKKQKKS